MTAAMASLHDIFDHPRVRGCIGGDPDPEGRCVVYWMRRSQRALDNPALGTAIATANRIGKPVVVFFCLRPRHRHAVLRHFAFMIEGLAETARRLDRRGIGFVMRSGAAASEFGRFCSEVRPAIVVTDENPLGGADGWRRVFPANFRLPMVAVDADVIVPSALPGREHFAARTIRPVLHRHLGDFLHPVGNQPVRVRWPRAVAVRGLDPSCELTDSPRLDRSIAPTPEIAGGTSAALDTLRRFIDERLDGYAIRRNCPELDGTSGLSPYLHFGQIGPHTVALAAHDSEAPDEDRDAFLEELIVRRELAINFVRYNPRYRGIRSCEPWALRTLADHARDRRDYLYSERRLENAETHDELWNAAQRQMVEAGWMHNRMRMYWAKKILEWSRSPAVAYEIAVRLNDRYELDGRDPNGYAGVAWAIGGKHDRAWGERPVFGKIRYMSGASTSRKFDNRAYMEKWSR